MPTDRQTIYVSGLHFKRDYNLQLWINFTGRWRNSSYHRTSIMPTYIPTSALTSMVFQQKRLDDIGKVKQIKVKNKWILWNLIGSMRQPRDGVLSHRWIREIGPSNSRASSGSIGAQRFIRSTAWRASDIEVHLTHFKNLVNAFKEKEKTLIDLTFPCDKSWLITYLFLVGQVEPETPH
jgi:hypothetical protein